MMITYKASKTYSGRLWHAVASDGPLIPKASYMALCSCSVRFHGKEWEEVKDMGGACSKCYSIAERVPAASVGHQEGRE